MNDPETWCDLDQINTLHKEVLENVETNWRGQMDKYAWGDFWGQLTGELNAAYLWAQLETADEINAGRLRICHC